MADSHQDRKRKIENAGKVARSENNTLAAKVVPVILVPGFMASVLDLKAKGTDETVSWNPDLQIQMASTWVNDLTSEERWRKFMLPGGVPAPQDGKEIPKAGFNAIALSYYRDLIQALLQNQQQRPVFAAAYDWRKSVQDCAVELKNRVSAVLALMQAKKCILVTHSMGGLVARYAAATDAGLSGQIAGMIHVAQPANGSPLAYRRLVKGTDAKDQPDDNLQVLFGRTGWVVFAHLSALPGGVALLPNDVYDLTGDTFVSNDDFAKKPAAWFGVDSKINGKLEALPANPEGDNWGWYGLSSPPGVVRDWRPDFKDAGGFQKASWTGIQKGFRTGLQKGRELHQKISSKGPWRHPNTLWVAGRGMHTMAGTEWVFVDNQWRDPRDVIALGDGTVPLDSAVAPPPAEDGSAATFVKTAKTEKLYQVLDQHQPHAEICNTPAVVEFVVKGVAHLYGKA